MIDLKAASMAEMDKTRDMILGFPWESRPHYASWLVQTFHFVSHSSRLLTLAAAHCTLDKPDLHARFLKHAAEEGGHERLCLMDLKELGYELREFRCSPYAAAMPQMQYYWIEHRGPASLFGYILSLEVLAVTFAPKAYQRVSQTHGAKAGNFLRVHSEDDLEHTAKAFEMLAQFPGQDLLAIRENLEISATLYRSILEDISEFPRDFQDRPRRDVQAIGKARRYD